MRVLVISFSLLFFIAVRVFSQGEIPMDMYTGRPFISVPLVTVTNHELSDAVSLTYDASGIRVQQPSGNFGLGWNLSAAGNVISRTVNGLPDDFTGVSSDARRGWFYTYGASSAASSVGSFPNAAATEANYYTALNGYSYTIDSEPDLFSFSFAGHSGSFVFDNAATPVPHFLEFSDLKISVKFNTSDKSILSFTITTDDGVKYVFDQVITTTRTTAPIATTIDFGKRNYSLYSAGATYASQWYLSNVISPHGAILNYTYNRIGTRANQADTFKVMIQNTGGGTYTESNIYVDTKTQRYFTLAGITSYNGATAYGQYAVFNYNTNNLLTSAQLYDTRNSNFYQNFIMQYSATYINAARYYLSAVGQISSCNAMPPYKFSYMFDPGLDNPVLPGQWSKSIDFWGYYNGRLGNTSLVPQLYYLSSAASQERVRLYTASGYSTAPGANRTPDSLYCQAASLRMVTYPTGGSTMIYYEPHQYYDSITNQNYLAGGLRAKRIIYFDGVNSSRNIVKNFTYADSLGHSSGRLISRPVFSILTGQYIDPSTKTVVNKSNDWGYMLARTEMDLSQQSTTRGSTVGYKEVNVYRPGSGHVRFKFNMPATYGNVAYGNWSPTTDMYARSNTSMSMGPITGAATWQFPYAPNINFEHARGLVALKQEFDESGTKVRQTQSYYQYLYKGTSPVTIRGLSYDNYPQASSTTFCYGYYTLQTELTKPLKTEKVTTWGLPDNSKYQITSTTYDYKSTAHRLLTQVTSLAPDGTKYFTRMKYPLDYGTVPSASDKPSTMIDSLQKQFRNANIIEQTSLIQKSGGPKRYVGGSVTQYSDFGVFKPFPKYSYSFDLTAPRDTTLFTSSYINGTSKVFKIDSAYELAASVNNIDAYGNVQSSAGQNNIISGVAWGYNNTLPNATVSNADITQIAFSDYETTTAQNFGFTSTPYYGTGRGPSGSAVYPLVLQTSTLTKGTGKYYNLSFWINSTAAISFTVILSDGGGVQKSTTSVSVPSSGGKFVYFSSLIDVSVVTTSVMTVTVQAPSLTAVSASSPSLSPVIDDVAFYPSSASLTSVGYTVPFGPNAVTSANQTAYTVYDDLGRKQYSKDTDGNILEKDTYIYPSIVPVLVAAFASTPSPLYDGINHFTAASYPCLSSSAVYQWKMNNGSYVTGSVSQSFDIPPVAGATVVITLKISATGYPADSVKYTAQTVLRPMGLQACATGAAAVNICNTTMTVTPTLNYECSNLSAPVHPSGCRFIGLVPFNDTYPITVTSTTYYLRTSGTLAWGSPVLSSTSSTVPAYSVDQILVSNSSSGYDVMCTVVGTDHSGTVTRTGSVTWSVTINQSCN